VLFAAAGMTFAAATAAAAQAPPPSGSSPPATTATAVAPAADVPSPLTFQAALDLAFARNLEYRAALLGRGVREAEVKTAGLYPNPDVSFEASKDSPHKTLSLDFPLEIGKRGRRLDLAREQLALADVDERTALLALRRSVRSAFFGLLAAEQSAALARSMRDVAGRLHEAAQARFETGAAPKLEVMAAELGLARAQADLDLAEAGRAGAQAELNAVLDRPPLAALNLAGQGADRPALPSPEQAVAIAASRNTALQAADREVVIEDRRLSLFKAERYPTAVVSVGALFDAPGEFDVGGRAALSLAVPLFSRNQGDIAGSLVRTSQAELRRAALRREVEARAYAALGRAAAQRAQADAYQKTLLPTAEAIESLAEESYRLGRGTLLSVLEAQRSLRDVRSEALAAHLAHQSALADLEDVLGGPIE
jgi:cobalt-zinc-cadmium efflux system outer membrane protein